MVANVTPYAGDLPDLQDPATFDARMTSFAAWFDTAIGEYETSIVELNQALNDNGTVLDALTEAQNRVTNAAVPVITTGTATAYSLTLPAPLAAITTNCFPLTA